jgi:hypothetical protein
MITAYDDIIAHIKKKTFQNKVLLSFSGGKDAWGTWIATREHFEIIPFYYYVVPGLEIIDEYLAECEKRLGRIRQYPHPMLYDMLNGCCFQPPSRVRALERMELPTFTKDTLHRCVEEDCGLPEFSTYAALGLRAADSIMRGSYFKNHGPINDKRKVFSPIFDWNKARLLEELRRNDVKLSREYAFFGRTMDGPVLLYTWGLKKYAPRDYARVLEFFPLLESEVWRYERVLAQRGNHVAEPL